MILEAPGKVNLYLEVVKAREDGYHQINTVIEKISLADEVVVVPSLGGTKISCDRPEIPTGSGSLLERTVKLFSEEIFPVKADFSVHLKKNIPSSAGLGGGSSDAAALLKGMNELTGRRLDSVSLMAIAGKLGCDVPFFVSDAPVALGEGRGDIIQKLDISGKRSYIIVKPPFGTLSGDIYTEWDRLNLTNKIGVDRILTVFSEAGEKLPLLARNLRNDLQIAVLRKFPELKIVLEELNKVGSRGSLVSGSGPSVFGLFPERKVLKARNVLRESPFMKKGWKIFIAETWGASGGGCDVDRRG